MIKRSNNDYFRTKRRLLYNRCKSVFIVSWRPEKSIFSELFILHCLFTVCIILTLYFLNLVNEIRCSDFSVLILGPSNFTLSN